MDDAKWAKAKEAHDALMGLTWEFPEIASRPSPSTGDSAGASKKPRFTLADEVESDDTLPESPPENPDEPDKAWQHLQAMPRTPDDDQQRAKSPTPPWRRTNSAPSSGRSQQGCGPLAPLDELPLGYGNWLDWDDEQALQEEAELALKHKMPTRIRGPASPLQGGPELWRDIPWNIDKGCWLFSARRQLPITYQFEDWWSEESLKEEARLAVRHMIPWSLRGPPNGPQPGGPKTWRDMAWRAGSCKWMSRGGQTKDARDAKYGVGKGKGKGNKK